MVDKLIFFFFTDGLSRPIGIYKTLNEHVDFMGTADLNLLSDFIPLSELDKTDKVLGALAADSFWWKGSHRVILNRIISITVNNVFYIYLRQASQTIGHLPMGLKSLCLQSPLQLCVSQAFCY